MILNINAIKTPTVILKLVHVILGAVSIGIVGYYTSSAHNDGSKYFPKGVVFLSNEGLFYLLTTFGFLLTSFLLLVTYLLGDTAEKIGKLPFEIIYHLFGAIFIFSAAVCHFHPLTKIPLAYRRLFPTQYALLVIAGICTLLNSILYLANVFVAFRLRSQDVHRGGIILSQGTSVQSVPYGQSTPHAPGSNPGMYPGLNNSGYVVKN